MRPKLKVFNTGPLDEVLAAVSAEYNIAKRNIKTPRRHSKQASIARDELARRLKELGYTAKDIGNYLCGRDKSSIFRAIKRAQERTTVQSES